MLVLVAVVRAAWLCDDAFITLRTVDNWVHGYGLRWNVSERVQAFTHPAWLLLVTLGYLPAHSASFALLAPAIVLTGSFLALLLHARRDAYLATGACLLLLASKGFIEFSTSGLENPLLHVLLLAYLFSAEYTLRTQLGLWRTLACASLILCTRLDSLWLIGPSLAGAVWLARGELRRGRCWLAMLPIASWEVFSLGYYGVPLPNTAYAKLNTAVPWDEALAQGLLYLKASAVYDAPTLVAIGLAATAGFAHARLRSTLLAAGILLWMTYLVRIGGDFMIGRLLTPALVVAIVLWTEIVPVRAKGLFLAASVASAVIAVSLPRSALLGAPQKDDSSWLREHVTDERALTFSFTGLFRTTQPDGPRGHPYTTRVLERVASGQRVLPARSIGFAGYFAGPGVHLVDEFGLAEPLLARLPADPSWNPGHFERRIPPGYLDTLASGRNRIEDATIARGYQRLAALIRDPVLSWSHIQAVVRWNLSTELIHSRDYQVRTVQLVELADAPRAGSVRKSGALVTDRQGLAVLLPQPRTIRRASIALGGDDRYLIAFRHGGRVVWQTWLDPSSRNRRRLRVRRATPSEPLVADSIRIRGRRGDGRYHVGGIVLD